MQTHIALWSDPIKRTLVRSQTEITGSGRNFERNTVCTMFWSWSDQGSIWSEKSDHRRILESDHKRFERNGVWSEMFSSAIESDQGPFRVPIFFIFLVFYWAMLAQQKTTIKQSSDQRLFYILIALIRKRSPADSKGRSPSEEILINWRPGCFLWKAV